MTALLDFLVRVRAVDRQTFIATNPPFFIVSTNVASSNQFATQSLSVAALNLATQIASGQIKVSAQANLTEVHAVEKSTRNPWAGRITIGRAGNNDIVLNDDSVSKAHAYLKFEGDAYWVVDPHSQNGTVLNGRKLKQDEEARLSSGDNLKFGLVVTRFFDSGGLYDFAVDQFK